MCCYGFSADALAPPSSQQRQEEGRREEAQRTSEVDVKKLSEPLSKIPSRMPYSSLDHSVRVEPDTSTVV